jgi:xanthine dehydrogenase accessory factor
LVDAVGLEIGDWSEAMALTPGGGRIGSLAGGAIDGQLTDLAGRWPVGRLVMIDITEVDALISGLPGPASASCIVAPAETLPAELWQVAIERRPLCLVMQLVGDEVSATDLFTEERIHEAPGPAQDLFAQGASRSAALDDLVISVFRPVPQLIVVGPSPVADALARLGAELGWQPRVFSEAGAAGGVIATLSSLDKVVVTAHDLELAGAALMAALDSEVGYIGSLGARRMQENRADWLAYRGVTDLSRLHGPAGLDIGAATPAEIAVSILAEAIAKSPGERSGAGR